MKKTILRNIAIVSAIFVVTFSIMLTVNYFQVRGTTPLQTEVIETLKEINDQNANNTVLQEQIRQLDLLARKAYFTRMEHLMTGVYILLGMLAVFIVCMRLYFAKDKDIPDKEIDPFDEWAIKTRARKYVVYVATGIAAVALLFVVLSAPFMKRTGQPTDGLVAEVSDNGLQPVLVNENTDGTDSVEDTDNTPITGTEEDTNEPTTAEDDVSTENNPTEPVASENDISATATESQPAISTVTHNAFRGNNSNGISAAKRIPVKWDLKNGTNIAWKKEVPRQGFNSPVINGNKIFCTGADDQARELYGFDLTTGALLWTLAATNIPGSPSNMPETTDDTRLAASSVATNGDKVCAIFATGDIICADTNGKLVWAKNLGIPTLNYGYASSLLIYGNSVIIQYDLQKSAKVLALDLATGAERWSKNRSEKYASWSSPMITSVNNTSQLILIGTPGISAYNPNNGELLWRVDCMTGEVAASACSADGIIYAASEHAKALAINGTDGSVVWENNDVLPEIASPVATKENFFIATSYGVVAALDTQTGEVKKEHEFDADFYSSPIIAEGKLYVISRKGKVFILTADNNFSLIDSFDTGEETYATPAFTDGKIIIRTEESLYCVTVN